MSSIKFIRGLNENLSGERIAATRDEIFDNIIYFMFESSSYIEDNFVRVLAYLLMPSKTKRKISAISRDKLSSLFSIIMAANHDETTSRDLVSLIDWYRIDKALIYGIIANFTEEVSPYRHAYDSLIYEGVNSHSQHAGEYYSTLSRVAERVGSNDHYSLYTAALNIEHGVSCLSSLLYLILQKYSKLAYKSANSAKRGTGIEVDKDDLMSNKILGIITAVIRYDSRLGAFASYLTFWLKDADSSSKYSHELGMAYFIPSSVRTKLVASNEIATVNIAQPLESDHHEIADDSPTREDEFLLSDEAETLFALARRADNLGFACVIMNVGYKLTKQDRKRMADSLVSKTNQTVAFESRVPKKRGRPLKASAIGAN